MADENTKEVAEPIATETTPTTLAGEIKTVGEIENTTAETKVEESPVVSETESIPSTVEPSIQDEVIKAEPASAQGYGEAKQEPEVIIETPVVESKPKEAPVVTPTTEPVAPITTPEPVAIPTHLSPLEALGASFVANMKRARELLVKAREVIFSKRKKKIEKIMTLFLKKSKIVNKDVRELLHTTEHTSTDYLNILLKEGKIKKEGKSSHAYYTKV